MKNAGNKSRGKTDTSLTGERSRTDEYIEVKGEKVNQVITDKITKNRKQADSEKQTARKVLDQKRQSSRKDPSISIQKKSQIEDKNLEIERKQSDTALHIERTKEDKLRVSERDQTEIINETLLHKERSETDSNLLSERQESDNNSKQASAELIQQTTIASTSQSDLAMRDQFLAVVSHDLKNPLNSICMAIEIMKDNLKIGDISSQKQMIDIIDRNAKVMSQMITDLLDIEQMTNGKLELKLQNTNICDLIKDCKTLFSPLVKSKNMILTVDLCEDVIMVNCDRDKILQVLSNLVGNSLKFSQQGKEIKITVKNNPLTISVIDQGPGISVEDQKILFNKFSQLNSNDKSGLGLGLFICKWIIETHNGEISVSSEINKGTSFSFTL